jgi:molybdenum-dependent DNA-binding transcriptional regulator ModE
VGDGRKHERDFRCALIDATKDGGATLTKLGYEVLQKYLSIEKKARSAIKSDLKDFEVLLKEKELK